MYESGILVIMISKIVNLVGKSPKAANVAFYWVNNTKIHIKKNLCVNGYIAY